MTCLRLRSLVAFLFTAVITAGCDRAPWSGRDANRGDDTPAPDGADAGRGEPPGDTADDPPAGDGSAEVAVSGAVWSAGRRYQARAVWTSGPQANDWSALRLEFYSARGEPLPAVELVEFKPWMTVHGHGAGIKKMTVARDAATPSVYEINKIWFTMSGPWDLLVEARSAADAPADKATIALEVP